MSSSDSDFRAAAERGDAPLLPTERLWGFWEFSYANSALAIATWAFLIGGAVGLFVGPKEGIAAIVIGNIIGVVLTALATCVPAGKYGIEQFVMLRSQFGTNGSRLVYFLAVIFLTMGWLAVLAMMFGRSIDGMTAMVSGGEASPTGIKMVIAALGAICLTWFIVARGPTSIKVFNMIVSPALVVLMVVMLVLILGQHALGDLLALPAIDPPFKDKHLNFIIAIEVNMAAGFSWWPYIGNLARLTKNERTAFWPNIVGIFGAAVLGEIVGLFGAVALANSDPTIWMTQVGGVGIGVIALGFVAFANITSMANILYTSIVGLRQVGTEGIRQIRWEILLALFCVIPVLLVLFYPGMYDGFFIFLVWTSALNSALAGIGIADYFFLRRQRLDLAALHGPQANVTYRFVGGFNPIGLFALAVGFLVYIWVFNPQTLANAAAFKYLTASIPSCFAAGLVHLVLTKFVGVANGWGVLIPSGKAGSILVMGAMPLSITNPDFASQLTRQERTMQDTFDYIVIGAGSAGCVLANRLSEDPTVSVLVLEFGGSDKSIFIQMPTALSIPMNGTKYNWRYETLPEPGLDGRRVHCPRGKVLGGSSSINGLVYMRGHPRDFDEWEALGAHGWGYANCLPYFQKAETWTDGGNTYRGGDGPLATNAGNRMKNPLYGAFVEAGHQAGYIKTDDPNGYMQEGFGAMHMTVKNGVRWSTANAYLRPALSRPNLKVITHAMTRRIILKNKRAVGVEYDWNGARHTVNCRREIVVSAGPIGSPHLLQRSGIGPGAVLAKAGVEVLHDLPGVGENLQDHAEVYIQYACKEPITLNGKMGLFSKFLIGAEWFFFKRGLGVSNHFESGGFIRSDASLAWPDIQFHFLPAAMRYDGKKPLKGHGFMVLTGPNKPKSRGYVRLRSVDPAEHPDILFNYLDRTEDREGFRRCLRLTREIIAQPAMDRYRAEEIAPGKDVQSDDEIDAFVRETLESTYHPCGTCRMGEDALAVVDSELRVRGIDGLRVVDSSVFPTEPNANLNAPTIMLAERASDMLRERPLLPASNAEVGYAPSTGETQRSAAPMRDAPT